MIIKEVSRELCDQGITSRIDTKAYWDSHGKAVYWDDKNQTIKFAKPVHWELFRVHRVMESEYIQPYEFDDLVLYINGVKLNEVNAELKDVGEITCLEALKTKLKLWCCIGCG